MSDDAARISADEGDVSSKGADVNEETMVADGESPKSKPAATDTTEAVKTLGGSIKTPAFCLLEGFVEDPESNERSAVSFPLVRLPAILGRTNPTTDPHMVGLGKIKALSRKQCQIDYFCNNRGRAMQQAGKDEFSFQEGKHTILNPSKVNLQTQPFFAVTCLGKNRILVNGKRVETGETIVIKSGDALRISSFWLYFLTPTKKSTTTIPIPPPPPSKSKKRKEPAPAAAVEPPRIKGRGGFASIQAELDTMSTEDMMDQLSDAIESDTWERRHQLMGSTLSFRAIQAAAVALQGETLSRGDIMDWVAKSDTFGDWSQQMLRKLEMKSYQTSITKAMIKAGFKRTASSGRYIKWTIPGKKTKKAKVATAKKAKDSEKVQEKKKSVKSKPESGGDTSTKREDISSTVADDDESHEDDQNEEADGEDVSDDDGDEEEGDGGDDDDDDENIENEDNAEEAKEEDLDNDNDDVGDDEEEEDEEEESDRDRNQGVGDNEERDRMEVMGTIEPPAAAPKSPDAVDEEDIDTEDRSMVDGEDLEAAEGDKHKGDSSGEDEAMEDNL